MFGCAMDCAEAPVIVPGGFIIGTDHVYVVPNGTILLPPLTGVTVNVVALQMVELNGDITGLSLTTTAAGFVVITAHPPDNAEKVTTQ